MASTKPPVTKEALDARCKSTITVINKIGSEAQSRVAAHIRAITNGKHMSLGVYHVSASIPMEEKFAEYERIWNALVTSVDGKPSVKPDWSKLQGSLGAGSKQAEEPAADLSHSLNRATRLNNLPKFSEEKKGATDISQPPRTQTASPVAKRNLAPPTIEVKSDLASVLARAIQPLLDAQQSNDIDESKVRLLIADEISRLDLHAEIKKANSNGAFPTERVQKMIDDSNVNQVRRVELVLPNGETKPITGLVHKAFDTILKMTRSRVASGHPVPIWLDGPPGGGKSHLMEQIAEALSLEPFVLAIGPSDTKTTIVGSVATGEFRPGIAYKPYKDGGLFGIDEVAAGDPGVLVNINSLIANQQFRFPNGELIKKHKDFHVIVADNTRGHGNVKGMIRNRLDAATLDRFAFLKVDYDETLESALCGNAKWAAYVKSVRDYIAQNSSESVYITPRASINGAALLAGGLDATEVANATVFRFCSPDLRNTIISNVGSYKV
jgi:cobaltochelatase CobS